VAIGAAGLAVAAGFAPVTDNQPKVLGQSLPNVLSAGLAQREVARGSLALENPDGIITNYGYLNNGPQTPPDATAPEAKKTEPDKNTYLVLRGQHGADPSYDYGTHFLFQGHEGGLSYITRINLDADAAHRVTLIGKTGTSGSLDGSTWNPFAKKLLFTGESGDSQGGMWQAGTDIGTAVTPITAVGFGGFEGVQADSDGNVWIVSDIGGPKGATLAKHARTPNSFIYRFVPTRKGDLLAGGKLQALRLFDASGAPITFTGTPDENILSATEQALHTYGNSFRTGWVTVHDTAVDGSAVFDANAAAKAAGATPFKRPENGVFRPGTGFSQFFFTETGDTDARTEAGTTYGGYGAIFKLVQEDGPSSSHGRLTLFFNADEYHGGFDNIQFLTRNRVLAVEDAGDTLHTQRGTLDSGYSFDIGKGIPTPVRFLAEGRDPAATLDSARLDSGLAVHQNDGDNEITGIHVSNGDPSIRGLLGGRSPQPWRHGWRVFFTQQHGENHTWEIVRAR
jgi:hypothetical protein